MDSDDIEVELNLERKAQLNRRSLLLGTAMAVAAAAGVSLLEPASRASANSAWGGYSNGQIPLSALDVVSYPGVIPYQYSSAALPYVYLVSGCSQRLLQMLQKYHDTSGGYLRVAEGYRTLAGQQYWLGKGGGPVGQSNHGWGEAVDFDKDLLLQPQADWLAANGPAYFFFPLAGDYGHYNYTGPITPPTATSINGDNDMLLLRNTSVTNQFALFGPGFWYEFTEASPWPVANGILFQIAPPTGVAAIPVVQAQWDAIKAVAQV